MNGSAITTVGIRHALQGLNEGINKTLHGHRILYCLSEKVEETCALEVILPVSLLLLGMLAFQAGLMLLICLRAPEPLLVTVGDAIASLIERNDTVLSPNQVPARYNSSRGPNDASIDVTEHAIVRNLRRRYWLQAASAPKWIVTISMTWILLWISIWFLHSTVRKLQSSSNHSVAQTFNTVGLGSINARTLLSTKFSRYGPNNIMINSLLANVPQLILSCLYFLYNSLFTSVLLCDEWYRFCHTKKGLRVSNPQGSQRSSYFLQLPFKYAIPLFCLFTLLQYFLSQSFFLARVLVTDIYGFQRHERNVTTVGYSPWAILISIVLGLILAVSTMLVGLRTYPSGMPFVGSCSAAIAAACCAQNQDRAISDGITNHDTVLPWPISHHSSQGLLSLKPLRWGAVKGENGIVLHHGFVAE